MNKYEITTGLHTYVNGPVACLPRRLTYCMHSGQIDKQTGLGLTDRKPRFLIFQGNGNTIDYSGAIVPVLIEVAIMRSISV